jgi:hypothetical protein
MNLTRVISIVLFILSLVLAGYLYRSISTTISKKEEIKNTEAKIIDKLAVIREAEKIFLEQYGHYTSNWDSLINFIETGEVPITVRTETIIPLSYGVDSIRVKIDTIDMIPARDKIFKKTHTVNAQDDFTFLGFMVKVGDYVVRGTDGYKFKKANMDRPLTYTFLDKGTISNLANITPGTEVSKGKNLISFWDYQLNPNVDVSKLSEVPGSGKTFDIYTGWIDRNGIKVNVIEVSDPAPINPDRRDSNEAKNRKPLRFGSRTDVSTAGNWE